MKKIFTFAVLAALTMGSANVMAQAENDYTDYIVNADLTGTDGWNTENTKGLDGSGIVKCGSGKQFDFSQTIKNLPAGQYKLTAKAAYRYGSSEALEYTEIQKGTETKFAELYATVGSDTVRTKVMNRYDCASTTDYANGSGSVLVNDLYVPNSSAAVQAWFNAGQYTNEVEFEVLADGDVTIGIVKTEQPVPGDYTVIGPWTLTRVGDVAKELDLTINVNRYPGLGYAADEVEVDLTEAKAWLGGDLTTSMLRIENPDGTLISDYAPYDGWFDGDGVATTWGDYTKICVKFFQAVENGKSFAICDMNGADEVGKTYTVKWQLVNGERFVRYTINVTFVQPEAVELELIDKGIVANVEYDSQGGSYIEKIVSLTDEQVSAICQELGFSSLDEATVYGYNPTTGELLSAYAGYDGWRDANGDFANHTGNASVPACVKYTDGQNYYCYSIANVDPQTIKCYWAIANEEKAVLVEIDFTYVKNDVTVDLDIVNKNIVASVEYDVADAEYTEKLVELIADQQDVICEELGISQIEDATATYGYNPTTGELVVSYEGFDGWRDANGDFHGWNSDGSVAPACVKLTNFGKTYYCYNRSGQSEMTIKCYWAIANEEKAVLVEIDFIYYDETTGITSVENGDGAAKIFNLAGQKMEKAGKGLYIVNGKKVIF